MPELTTCEDASAWDAFVSQASDASLLQAWAWGSLKSRYGWRVQRYFWMEAGQPIGAAAVLRRGLPGGLALDYARRGRSARSWPRPARCRAAIPFSTRRPWWSISAAATKP